MTVNQPKIPHALAEKLVRLGQRIRQARHYRNWSQKEFATAAAMSSGTVRRIEKGDHRVGIWAYAMALHVCGLASDIDVMMYENHSMLERRRLARMSGEDAAEDSLEAHMKELDRL